MTIVVPNHIAVIPDGNRRWARNHKKEVLWSGHEQGAKQFETIMRAVFAQGVNYLTIWAASEDNLIKRPQEEIAFLVKLLTSELQSMAASKETYDNNIRVQVLGRGEQMVNNAELSEAIAAIQEKTKTHTKHLLTILFGYDGQSEMLAAIEKMKNSTVKAEAAQLRQALATGALPDVDLVIRTGGEPHWSAGFMMWQTANSQFYFTETLWPDFNEDELKKALADYAQRERRLGK